MTLSNLVGISLEKIRINHDTIKKLESTVKDCIIQAEKLLQTFNVWLTMKNFHL